MDLRNSGHCCSFLPGIGNLGRPCDTVQPLRLRKICSGDYGKEFSLAQKERQVLKKKKKKKPAMSPSYLLTFVVILQGHDSWREGSRS